MAIALYGGAFDPIHYGHLSLAREIQHRCRLSKVIFIPAGIPPHKKRIDLSTARTRYEMVCRATQGFRHFIVSPFEVRRTTVSYSIDTIRYFRKVFGETEPLFFAMGYDAYLEIQTWKEYEQIPHVANLLITSRAPQSMADVAALPSIPGLAAPLVCPLNEMAPPLTTPSGSLLMIEIPDLAISSSDLRRRVREGAPIDHLCPRLVWRFIKRRKLYREGIDNVRIS